MSTRTALRGQPLPDEEAFALWRMTSTITAAERMWDERAARMAALREQGYSLDAIAAATGISREGVRKSITRWQGRGGTRTVRSGTRQAASA